MHILRTRFAKDIVSEYLAPARASRKVVIFCCGMPSYAGKRDEMMRFFAERGFWCFVPRYRGTWESGGQFLKKSPHVNILDVINGLEKGFTDAWSGKRLSIRKPQVFVVGNSFGGPAALLVGTHPLVKRVLALSPVADWREESDVEPLDFLGRFVREGFGEGYRFDQRDWDRLKPGRFYNPATSHQLIAGKKTLIVCAKDDEVVPCGPTVSLAKDVGADLIILKEGGHGLHVHDPKIWRRVRHWFA